MGALHDDLSTFYGNLILKNIRNEDQHFKQIFSSSIIRIGAWDWPRPDYVCFDEKMKTTFAIEFKPPFQSKREYLTGLGQSFSYLQKHHYAGLILPYTADDGFPIANFVLNSLNSSEFSLLPISLYAYDYNEKKIEILKPISSIRKISNIDIKENDIKTFWCWWRDISHYELYDLLNLSFIFSDYARDIYTRFVYPEFYKKLVNKQTKQWDGSCRNKKASEASMKSEKQNYKIPLVQLGLWGRSEGRLTNLGFKLLEVGKKYGPNSNVFLDFLTYIILVKGKHLDLINLIDKFQKENLISNNSSEYTKLLEKFLSDNGCIGKRKPTAVTTGAKNSYIRDEMKLWMKLGLLESYQNKQYFFPNKGYCFNWNKITSAIVNGSKLI